MKHLIIGAGATLAEAINLGVSEENLPPLMNNFAQKTWQNYTPHPLLELYLKEVLNLQYLKKDPRIDFFEMERIGKANIESFMEFAWENRNKNIQTDNNIPPGYINGCRISSSDGNSIKFYAMEEKDNFWENFLYHGIGNPISSMILQSFFEIGKGWKDFSVSRSIAKYLKKGDLVLNLNYDTIFELALQQENINFFYTTQPSTHPIEVCKPHGSLNLISNKTIFAFCEPDWLGIPQVPGFLSYSGLMPPRLNKSYKKNPIAKALLKKTYHRNPKHLIFWGIGMTESDIDLLRVYKKWSKKANTIDVINPSYEIAIKIGELLNQKIKHYLDHYEWIESQKYTKTQIY